MKSSHSLEILFEDQWIIVVSKPSGMLSVGFPGHRGKTAQDILADMNRSRGKIKIGAVHRLDRDTSGVMMFACTAEAKERIMDSWQEMVSERIYRCVCLRDPGSEVLPESGTIDAPLAYNRSDVAYVPRAKDAKALKDAEKAVTHFRVLERGVKYDLVECELETGRKNQIRAHMAYLGHPVAGDDTYVGAQSASQSASGAARGASAGAPIDRLALHARVLAFTHPYTGDPKRFEVPEPESFSRLVGGKKSAGMAKTATKKESKDTGAKTRTAERMEPGTAGDARNADRRPASGAHGGAPAPEKAPTAKLPRRQRGKAPRTEPRYEAHNAEPRERDVEDLTDLKALPKKSRTRQDKGKSRFIPGK